MYMYVYICVYIDIYMRLCTFIYVYIHSYPYLYTMFSLNCLIFIMLTNYFRRFYQNEEFVRYREETSILIPLPPLIYRNMPSFIKGKYIFIYMYSYMYGLSNYFLNMIHTNTKYFFS
jgi:hypothetical protein